MSIMEHIAPVLEVLAIGIDLFSIIIIIMGVLTAFVSFLLSFFKKQGIGSRMKVNGEIKIKLGSYILLSLEVLICADIIKTIINPNVTDILVLAAIVVIRTVISHFLQKEIEATRAEQNIIDQK